ncbi:OmpH family outer membrane protein [Faecalibacter macacae]|uniref:OmpH family outer membrane protein n=1 Tax=Faecalibacter macacae TaxID=1859289 RepID=A0A3L9MES5_9FLAO|nr:OmpH family outer membrane protein [Faecalibacter macacae]RLZ10506.1 OmpH family outer membrane protein [Faecalibacter macacae]
MKRWISFVVVFLGLVGSVSAQKFCYVDTQYILENLPEYTNSQNRLKTQTENWQKEIEAKSENLIKVQAAFEAEKILLTAEQVKEQEKKIADELKAIKDLQEKRYGPTGDLVFMRRALVKPIQDQIYNATKQVADKRGYSFVFDKGSDLIMIYTDPKFDISRDVLNVLKPENTPKQNTNNRTSSNNKTSTGNKTNTTNKTGTSQNRGTTKK